MQFSNHYLVTTIKNARIVQGHCPPSLSLTTEIDHIKAGDIFCFTEESISPHLEKIFSLPIAGLIIAHSIVDQMVRLIKQSTNHTLFILAVPNVIHALYQLAKQVRIDNEKQIVIAIAGTGGTRVTKTVLANILNYQGDQVIIHEEKNSSLLKLACIIINACHSQKSIIFEAISHKRYDIKTIAEIIRPSYAIINSIGHYNIDTIGSVYDVATEQRDIFSFFTEKNIGVINGDQKELSSISYPHPIIKFGLKISNQIQARKIRIVNSQTHCVLKIYKNKYPIVLKTTNSEILLSILSTIAMAKLLSIPDENIVSVIQQPLHIPHCFEIKKIGLDNGNIIDDTENAGPESVKASLMAFQKLESRGPKIIVLGNMKGLGINSAFWHRQIGRFLNKIPSVNRLFIIGAYGEHVIKTVPKELDTIIAQEWHELIPHLKELFSSKPVILIKGDRANGLSQLVNTLCNEQ